MPLFRESCGLPQRTRCPPRRTTRTFAGREEFFPTYTPPEKQIKSLSRLRARTLRGLFDKLWRPAVSRAPFSALKGKTPPDSMARRICAQNSALWQKNMKKLKNSPYGNA